MKMVMPNMNVWLNEHFYQTHPQSYRIFIRNDNKNTFFLYRTFIKNGMNGKFKTNQMNANGYNSSDTLKSFQSFALVADVCSTI